MIGDYKYINGWNALGHPIGLSNLQAYKDLESGIYLYVPDTHPWAKDPPSMASILAMQRQETANIPKPGEYPIGPSWPQQVQCGTCKTNLWSNEPNCWRCGRVF